MSDHEQAEFFFDYISPNAYLAWAALPALTRRYRVEFSLRPILFAGLLKASGQLGPAEIPAKSRWMWRNVLRKAKRHGIPLGPPASHPFNSLTALRMTLALQPRKRFAFADAVFSAAWVHGHDISDPAVLVDLANAVDTAGKSLLDLAGAAKTKAALIAETAGAYQRGVFGVPAMIAGDEVFWGFDDLGFFSEYLAGNDPLTDSDAQDWADIRPSAWRKEADQ